MAHEKKRGAEREWFCREGGKKKKQASTLLRNRREGRERKVIKDYFCDPCSDRPKKRETPTRIRSADRKRGGFAEFEGRKRRKEKGRVNEFKYNRPMEKKEELHLHVCRKGKKKKKHKQITTRERDRRRKEVSMPAAQIVPEKRGKGVQSVGTRREKSRTADMSPLEIGEKRERGKGEEASSTFFFWVANHQGSRSLVSIRKKKGKRAFLVIAEGGEEKEKTWAFWERLEKREKHEKRDACPLSKRKRRKRGVSEPFLLLRSPLRQRRNMENCQQKGGDAALERREEGKDMGGVL